MASLRARSRSSASSTSASRSSQRYVSLSYSQQPASNLIYPAQVDNAKLAELAGFANAESCRTNLSKILKKAAGGAAKTAEDRSEKSASPEVTKKMAGGRKRKAGT